jgi:Bromodomain
MPVCNDYTTTDGSADDRNDDDDDDDMKSETPLLLKPITSPRAYLNRLLRRVVLFAMQQDGAQQFLEAVSLILYPDYEAIVPFSMDLGTMHMYTTENYYGDVAEFQRHLELIKSNCDSYCGRTKKYSTLPEVCETVIQAAIATLKSDKFATEVCSSDNNLLVSYMC